ncbi:hypothetical protein [Burkholderia pseudomallei]|uniref:hypothetical protein n=1 Tax=Burkholderia pseudomallei TaxID=28450 RepID=UPI0005729139|nr:hypothetical protein [Burkholderia pseudomallei]
MKPLTEMQKIVVHTLARFGDATIKEIAARAMIDVRTVKETMRRLRHGKYIARTGEKRTGQSRPSPLYAWTGESYGEPPAMPHIERELAMQIATRAIDAMCRVGRPPLRLNETTIAAMFRMGRA